MKHSARPAEVAALRAARQALSARLAQGLADDAPLPELQALQDRGKILDAVLSQQARRGAWRPQIAAVVLVAALVSGAAWWPMPTVDFALDIEAGAMQLQMDGAGSLAGGTVDGELRAEGFDAFESADAAWVQRAKEEGAGQMTLQAQRLTLRRITFAPAATVGFEGGPQAIHLSVSGVPQSAEMEVGGRVSSSFYGAASQADYPFAEWVRLRSGAGPTDLWLGRAAAHHYVWRGLSFETLRCVQRQAGADQKVRVASSLQTGLVHLPATERDVHLAAGSDLALDGVRVRQAELTVGDNVTLKLSGTARRMVAGTGDFEQSLKPSVLEYAAHNHTLELLWSAAGLLWGIGTWLRKLDDAAS